MCKFWVTPTNLAPSEVSKSFFFFLKLSSHHYNSCVLHKHQIYISNIIFFSLKECESEVIQSCPTLCNLVDCSPPGSSVHEILQARLLKWVAISFSRGSSWPRDQTRVSCTASSFFYRVCHQPHELSWARTAQLSSFWPRVRLRENKYLVLFQAAQFWGDLLHSDG